MELFKKYLGVCLLILGVVFLVVYKYAMPENSLLIAGMVCEVAGILAYGITADGKSGWIQ